MGKMVTKAVSAQNTFTDAITLEGCGALTVSGTFVATVSLQVKADGVNWVDTGDTITAPGRRIIQDGTRDEYRAGVKTGGFTSGTATIVLKSE
jgi:hypothetical protein